MNDCFLNLLFSFQLLLPLKDEAYSLQSYIFHEIETGHYTLPQDRQVGK